MEQVRKFDKSNIYPQILQRGAKVLRDDGQFIDFTIIADGTRFAAHKLILATVSEFFRTRLSDQESVEYQTNECHLHDITSVTMEAILEFCYTSQLELGNDNVREILAAASILIISQIQSICVEYIREVMGTTNCLSFLILAEKWSLHTLTESALEFCLENFETVSEQEEFLQLDASLLTKIISHNQLSVSKEELVLSAAVKWIAADEDNRDHELDNLLDHVRFVLFSPINLVNGTLDDLAMKSTKCRELIDEAKKYHILETYSPELRSQMVGKRFEPRWALNRQHCIFAAGGWSDKSESNRIPMNTAEKYYPYLDKWFEIKQMTTPRGCLAVTISDHCLYAVGGDDGEGLLQSVECYNIKEDFWRCDVADLKVHRASVGTCVWRGHVYAIGGEDASNIASDVVERYNPRTNQWTQLPRLLQKRLCPGVTVCEDSIYVVGGGIKRVAIGKVEKFNANENKWSFVTPLTTARSSFGCTTLQGRIYAVGGLCDNRILDTAECYDPVEDCWEPIPGMSVARHSIGLVAMDGLLYAVGGEDGDASLKLVEAYDPVKREWTTKCPMTHARQYGAFASYSPTTGSSVPKNDVINHQVPMN